MLNQGTANNFQALPRTLQTRPKYRPEAQEEQFAFDLDVHKT